MAAGGPGSASGKSLAAALRPEGPSTPAVTPVRVAQAGRKGGGQDPRPAEVRPPARQDAARQDDRRQAVNDSQARRDDAASASREAANAADSRAQARAQGAADAADRRSAFSAALDKARGPAQPAAQAQAQAQSAARQAANSTGVTDGAMTAAAAAGTGLPAAQETADAAPDHKEADGSSATDALDAASAAVASLLGWLQPVVPVQGRQSTAGDGAGAEGDARDDAAGAIGASAAASVTGVPRDAAAGNAGDAQAGAQQPPAAAAGNEPGDARDAATLAAASGNSGSPAPHAGSLASALAESSPGATAYATRYGEPKPAIAPNASAQAAQAAGFDANQSIRASAAALAAPVERSVPAPMGDRHWARALSTQVLLLANHKIESATLRLSPEHTGPVEVRIQMQDSAINLAFSATQADTRAALEQALPQLRAAFAGAGLALGQATVGQQMRQGSQFSNGTPNGTGLPADHPEATAAVIRPAGLLDEYA